MGRHANRKGVSRDLVCKTGEKDATSLLKETTITKAKNKRKKSSKKIEKLISRIPPYRKHVDPSLGKCSSIYCPGSVNELPWIQCKNCWSLVHLQCLGILSDVIQENAESFVCSGCNPNWLQSIKKEKYMPITRKLRRSFGYINTIVTKKMISWRMTKYSQGGNARRDLKYSVVGELVDDPTLDLIIEELKSWVKQWHIILKEVEMFNFCTDVLLPEILIHIIMTTERIHRDHAEYLYSKCIY